MIRNRNLDPQARKRRFSGVFDISSAGPGILNSVTDNTNDLKVTRIELIYAIATDAGTILDTIQVGTGASPTLYANITVAASTAVGTVTNIALSSTALVPNGTPLIISRATPAAGTNTGEVVAQVSYELVDI